MTTEEKILEKVRKMLALANCEGASEEERDNALKMAHDLLAKYELDMADVQSSRRDEEDPRGHYMDDGWNPPYARSIRRGVANLFNVKYYSGAKINGTRGEHHYIGRESAATTAMYMSNWIIKGLVKEADRRYTHRLTPLARSFCIGASHRLYERIQEIIAAKQAEFSQAGYALVLYDVAARELEANMAFLAAMGVKLTTTTRRQTVRRQAWEAGKEYANDINLNTQLGAKKAGQLGSN